MARASELRDKEVINLSDGRRLGFIHDVEVSMSDGNIESIIILNGGKLFGILGRDSEFIIPWEKVKKIGDDIILVDLDERYIRKHFDM